ncbi:MAG TPA: sigma 54-interacting transcriptional regulator [Planctomycetota bacterium]|jgi:transcriptional regulator with GAF, ATPase, and Fis domain|nr:sigma 54-interacting transcriptional regulator [Planctomycetota bacterium]
MESDPLVAALGQMTRAVSETLELKEVFARVAEAAATALPFDVMGVARLEGEDALTVYAVAGDVQDPPRQLHLGDFSPVLRVQPGTAIRIDDAARELDPSFPMDRELLRQGVRSVLRTTLLRGEQLAGTVSFWSRRPGAFTVEHEAALRPIADLLSLALEHERLWSLDTARRRRLDAIDTLLLTMAGSLDVREIFNRVSEIVRPVLPHDRLVLTSLRADRREISVDAISGEPVPGLPTRIPAGDPGACLKAGEVVLIPDVEEESDIGSERHRWCRAQGTRSVLKIPLRLDGGLGSLVFLSRAPRQYSEEDVVVARRVADHVSLALSHQRLAEEERRAAEARERAARLEERVEALKNELETTRGFRRVVGESKKWTDLLAQAAKVARAETTVLLTGESGTGKEVVARFIHRGSPRADGSFVALNCAALPETLLESELFGHERGAFSGATAAHPGRIEQAAGGVLFLDEVGEMSPAVQAKFLRVLEEREFQRLGGTRPMRADVRVVAATNRDLEAALARGAFREDLYYRLRVFEIRLPPLRERRTDILPLAEAFLEEIGSAVGRPAAGISREAHDALLSYPWPGNVRELRNALERATILCDGGLITVEHLPIGIGPSAPATGRRGSLEVFPPGGVNLQGVERDLIAKALRQARNNRSRAARLLGITRSQLYSRMQKHGLDAGPSDPPD